MFTKHSLHHFYGTFSYFLSKRMVFDGVTGEGLPAGEAPAPAPKDDKDEALEAAKDKKGEKVDEAKDAAKDSLVELKEEVKPSEKALKEVARIIGESPEAIGEAMYKYDLSEHEESFRKVETEATRIINKIIAAKKEGKLDGITFMYVGGTNGKRHDLNKLEATRNDAEQKEWHQKKADALANILIGKKRIQPIRLQTLVATNEATIKEYIAKVAANNDTDLRAFLRAGTNESTFCVAGGLFDLALAYQRADDLYGTINEGRKINPRKDLIGLSLKTDSNSIRYRKSKLYFTMPEGAKGEVAPAPGPNDLPPENPPKGKGEVVPAPAPVPPAGEPEPAPAPSELPPPTPKETITGTIEESGKIVITVEPNKKPEGGSSSYELAIIPNIPEGLPPLVIVPGEIIDGHKTLKVYEKIPGDKPGRLQFTVYITTDPEGNPKPIVINNPPDKNLKPTDKKPTEYEIVQHETLKGTWMLRVLKQKNVLPDTPKIEPAGSAEAPRKLEVGTDITRIDTKKYEKQIKEAKEALDQLDPETKRRLHYLTTPIFEFENSLQPQSDANGRYYVHIDIRDTQENIKKNLKEAARMIIEEDRFLDNTPKENEAHRRAAEKRLPFVNIRQAYLEDLKRGSRINWNGQTAKPNGPYVWAEGDQGGEWFNYAVETPLESAARLQKNRAEKEAENARKREAMAKEHEKKPIADQKDEEEGIRREEEAEASPEDAQKLDDAIAAHNQKKENFKATYKVELRSHVFYKKPYKERKIKSDIEYVDNLNKRMDVLEGAYKQLGKDTKDLLTSVQLVIDKGKGEENITRSKDGNYQLYIDILKDEGQIRKDIIARKNEFVKSKACIKDSPLEEAQRKIVGAKFKNIREAYQEKGIVYDSKEGVWNPAKNRKWANANPEGFIYDYSTESIVAPAPTPTPEPPKPAPTPKPTPAPKPAPAPKPTPAPKPAPKPAPETTPEKPYQAASTDRIYAVGDVINTKQQINGKNETDDFSIIKKVEAKFATAPRRLKNSDGEVLVLDVFANDDQPMGYIYLDKNGTLKTKSIGDYVIKVAGKNITISKKKDI